MTAVQRNEMPASEVHGTMIESSDVTEHAGENGVHETETDRTAGTENSVSAMLEKEETELPASSSQLPTTSVEHPTVSQIPTLGGGRQRTQSASSQSSSPVRSGIRSTSSKFASLKAAFEPGSSTAGSATGRVKRRLISGEKNGGRVEERKQNEAEIARLKEELEKEKELRVAFEEKLTSLDEEIDDLNARLEEQDVEYERRVQEIQAEAEDRISLIESEATNQKGEASNLQKQLSDLKRSVSTSTRTSSQVSDSTFRQEMEVLQHEIQNWVVNNFRRAKIDVTNDELCDKLEKVTEPQQLERLRPVYKTYDNAVKFPILQATVACYMMEVFDEPFLFGLSGQRDWGKRLKQAAEGLRTVLDSRVFTRWRTSTFDTLRQAEGMKQPIESAGTGVAELICISLVAITEAEDSATRLASLKPIVHRAISLAHLLRVQQAQYEFLLPSPGDLFDAATMDDISHDSEVESGRSVRCATFPTIFKFSDENGDVLDGMNLVVKAKVLCDESKT